MSSLICFRSGYIIFLSNDVPAFHYISLREDAAAIGASEDYCLSSTLSIIFVMPKQEVAL